MDIRYKCLWNKVEKKVDAETQKYFSDILQSLKDYPTLALDIKNTSIQHNKNVVEILKIPGPGILMDEINKFNAKSFDEKKVIGFLIILTAFNVSYLFYEAFKI